MSNSNEYDYDFSGQVVPQLIVSQDHMLTGTHQGTVRVEAGHFTLTGTLQGSLALAPGVIATIRGVQQGSVAVAPGAMVVVTGAIQGSLSVASGATVIIEAAAKLAGSMDNYGLVIVRGVFGGSRSGNGELRLEDHGYIKQPTTIRDGVRVYEW